MNKVLVVDDSALMRRHLSSILKTAGYQVATAANGAEGVNMLMQWQPDAVTLDVNMPEMDGLTALSLMMQARPTPVIMVSSLTERGAMATLEAMALGAVDYVAKPGGTISLSIDEVEQAIVSKVQSAIAAKPRLAQRSTETAHRASSIRVKSTRRNKPEVTPPVTPQVAQARGVPLVLIGVSTGGPRTLEDILPLLPADLNAAILIAQHMPPTFTEAFAHRMDRLCNMRVREVNTMMPIEAGHIYVGKGGTDVVVSTRLGRAVVAPRPEDAAHPWHPSADILVNSAMSVYSSEDLIGVMLTGMGNDGSQAMTQLRKMGGRTIAESQETAIVFGMPQDLIERGGADLVLPATDIAAQLLTWLK